MDVHDSTFDITLSQIPLWNLRNEFSIYLNLFRDDAFCRQFGHPYDPISSPILVSSQSMFLTIATQRAIVGIESYVVGALYIQAGLRRLLDDSLLDKLRHTDKFQGRGTADKLFNSISSVIDSKFALRTSDPVLWEQTQALYKTIRNLLFHGYEFSHQDPYSVKKIMELLFLLHLWVDKWHPPGWEKAWEKGSNRSDVDAI